MDNINKKKEADLDAALTDAAIGVKDAVKDLNGMNYEDFTEGSDYASLAKRYNNMGKQAMKDTMGQASARTGGYANSYAVQAGQQAQNSFMEKLEEAARGLYDSQRQEKLDKVNVANAMYDRAYGEKQDAIANQQWQKTFDYNADRDDIEDERYANQQAEEDKNEYLDNLYTDFSLMNDEELEDLLNGNMAKASGENPLAEYLTDGVTESDIIRLAKMAKDEKNQQLKDSFTYGNDANGVEGIMGKFNGSGFNLSERDQANFDYIFGDGAYEKAREAIPNAEDWLNRALNYWRYRTDDKGARDGNILAEELNKYVSHLSLILPGAAREQILDIIENECPEFIDFAYDPDSAREFDGKLMYNGEWVTPAG